MARTPDRRPGPSFEEESILFDGTVAATIAGEVRYDGTSFSMFDTLGEFDPRNPASSENAIVQARRTTTESFPTTWMDLGFDVTDEETDDAVISHDPVTNNERITINRTGNYRINYELASDQQSGDDMEARLFLNNTSVVPGSNDMWGADTHNQQHNARLGRTILVSMTAGDFVTVQIQNTGTGGTVKVDAVFNVNAMTGATGATGPAGGGGAGFPEIMIFGDMFEPVNADWPITVLAPAVKLGSTSRFETSYDDATETGIGWQFRVPDSAANMTLELISRAQTGPGSAEVARYNVRESGSPDNAADTAFSSPFQFPDIDIPSGSTNRQYDSVTRTMAEWGFTTGEVHQLLLSRDTGDAADTLVGNLLLLGAFMRFT